MTSSSVKAHSTQTQADDLHSIDLELEGVEDVESLSEISDNRSETRSLANTTMTALTATTVSKLLERDGYMVSIIESRGSASQIGLAAFSLSSMSCTLYQLTDTATYSGTLAILANRQPDAFVLNEAANRSAFPSRLYERLQKEFPEVMVFPLARSDYNSTQGAERLRVLALPEHHTGLSIDLENKAYALAALNALIKVLEQQITIRPQSLNIEFKAGNNRLLLDIITIKNLELVKSLDGNYPRSTLISSIDHTSTSMGKRQLRNQILQPYTSREEIQKMQECIKFFIREGDLSNRIKDLLKEICNFDQIISSLVCTRKLLDLDGFEVKITRIFQVNSAFKSIKDISTLFTTTENIPPSLQNIKSCLEKEIVEKFVEEVGQVINEDIEVGSKGTLMQHVKCYAIKEGVDNLLDTSRKAFSEVSNDVQEYIEGLSRTTILITVCVESTGLTLTCKWTKSKGFLIRCNEDEIPNYFIACGSRQFQTLDLVLQIFTNV